MANAPSGNLALKQQAGMAPQDNSQRVAMLIAGEMPRIKRLIQDPKMTSRFGQLALQEIRRNPKLFDCKPESIVAALMASASLGLQIGVGGQCFLVPYGKECTFVTGWKGHVTLATRSGAGNGIWTGAAREGDEFDWNNGSRPGIHHKTKAGRDAKITHFYANAYQPGSRWPVVEVWSMDDILKHRARFNKVGEKHYSYGSDESFEAYGRKIPLLQAVKYLPQTFEMDMAQKLDYAADEGTQKLRPADIEDGLIVAPPEPAPALEAPSGRALTETMRERISMLNWPADGVSEFMQQHSANSDAEIESLLEAELDRE